MKRLLIAASIFICSVAATAADIRAETYSFTWHNRSSMALATTCSYLEIQLLNNGFVVATKNGSGLQPNMSQKMELNAPYCSNIQLKAVCSGRILTQSIGCMGGNILITSPSAMTFAL